MLSVCLSVCQSVCLPACLPVCLAIHLYIYLVEPYTLTDELHTPVVLFNTGCLIRKVCMLTIGSSNQQAAPTHLYLIQGL